MVYCLCGTVTARCGIACFVLCPLRCLVNLVDLVLHCDLFVRGERAGCFALSNL